ncbi:MAG: histidine kinase dimerization/phospho-acceptor domain-containing protein, partial [Burkholderiaceae bacterium]|nr:histidine kinase dimerization/phospho-acceptor domain-containing protein [Burkholderiaceae bacterium]
MTLLPNPLLLSQLQHAWGLASSQDVQRVLQAWPPLAPGAVEAVSRQQAAAVSGLTPDEVLRTLPSLLAQVNSTYALMEQDLAHSRHSLEMRSAELTQANQRLQEEARQQLKESEERLALAVQGSNIGLWDWDLQTDEVYFSAEWAAMLGYAVHDLAPTASTLVGLLHPGDGKRFGQALGVYFEHDTTEMYRDDVRLRCKDGSYKWVEFKGRIVQCAPDGQPLRATGVSLDISARKAWEQGVADARDAAEAASRAKGDFLANMSHEIRTPKNGILGLTQLCLSTTLDDEQRGYLDMVHASARSLLTVINDVLDFSKIEARKLDIEAVVFHLPQVVRHAAAPLAHTAQERALSLLAEVDAELPPWRVGDPGRLRQVLLN